MNTAEYHSKAARVVTVQSELREYGWHVGVSAWAIADACHAAADAIYAGESGFRALERGQRAIDRHSWPANVVPMRR